jgi:hypothetical protein
MRTRMTLLVGALLAIAVPAAHAQPAGRTCHLVRDAHGDVQADITAKARPGKPSQALDIVEGDIAADVRALTTVIRLAGPVQADSYSPTGFSYSFQFTIDAGDRPQTFEMNADIGPMTQTYSLLRYDENAGFTGIGSYVRGALYNSNLEIHMTADMSQLQKMADGTLQFPEGHRLRDFQILSGTSTGEQSHAYVNSQGEDVAYGYRITKIGAPSCVRHG